MTFKPASKSITNTDSSHKLPKPEAVSTQPAQIDFKDSKWSVFDRKKIDMFAVKLEENGGFNLAAFNKIGGEAARAVLPCQKAREATLKFY